ncbi:MAG: hypothetical protein ABW184_18010 [Sphingobium sp.]
MASLACPAFAETTGVFLPPAPTGSGGEDSIETSSGTRCRQSMNGNGAYVDVGMTGTAGSPTDANAGYLYRDSRDKEATAYVRMTIPLGKRPARIDCARLYELELDKLRREVELLRLGAR